MNKTTDRQSRRDTLTAGIIEQVRNAIQEELAFAPQSLTDQSREEIENEVLTHSRMVVDALSTEEMTSEGALLSHIANARCDTVRYMRDWRTPKGPDQAIGKNK
jgi:hypothetical protein